jgi:7,8-dihydro-6-hydroxymethylpterin-pyrophosphokinase
MRERAFVLKPLLEISPELKTYEAFLDACKDQKIEIVQRG